MQALSALANNIPNAHLLLAGEPVDYYDMQHESRMLGIDNRVTILGLYDDAEIGDYLAASDVGLCMRWPTSATSASWLRCLAAGKPTISTAWYTRWMSQRWIHATGRCLSRQSKQMLRWVARCRKPTQLVSASISSTK